MLPTTLTRFLTLLTKPRRLAYAHSGKTSYVNVSIRDGGVSGEVQYPIHDLNHVLELSIPEDETTGLAAIKDALATIEAYTREHFTIGDGDEPWPYEFTGYRILGHDHGGYAIVKYKVSQSFGGTPPQLSVTFDGIIHQYQDREALVIVKTSRGFGDLRAKSQNRLTINASNSTQEFFLENESLLSNIAGAATATTIRAKRLLSSLMKRG